MSINITVIPTVVLTFLIGALISSGSRQWFGKPVVLSAKQYLLRCALAASILLSTLFSFCQGDILNTVVNQKILVLLTMASSIAVDHFYSLTRDPNPEPALPAATILATAHPTKADACHTSTKYGKQIQEQLARKEGRQ